MSKWLYNHVTIRHCVNQIIWSYYMCIVYIGNYEHIIIIISNFGCREAVSRFKVIEWREGLLLMLPRRSQKQKERGLNSFNVETCQRWDYSGTPPYDHPVYKTTSVPRWFQWFRCSSHIGYYWVSVLLFVEEWICGVFFIRHGALSGIV